MRFKFAIWQFFLLQAITGIALKQLNHPLMITWGGGYAIGLFVGAFVIALMEHYCNYKPKEAKKKKGLYDVVS